MDMKHKMINWSENNVNDVLSWHYSGNLVIKLLEQSNNFTKLKVDFSIKCNEGCKKYIIRLKAQTWIIRIMDSNDVPWIIFGSIATTYNMAII